MTEMPTSTRSDREQSSDYVVDGARNYIEKQTLTLLYELYEGCTRAMAELRRRRGEGRVSQRDLREARTSMCDLIGIVRPQMQSHPVWSDRELGTMSIAGDTNSEQRFVGLSDLYDSRQGIRHTTYEQTPGAGRSEQKTTTVSEPSYAILEAAWDAIQDWMADSGLGLPIGTAAGTDR